MSKDSKPQENRWIQGREHWWWLSCFLIAILFVLIIARRLYGL